MPVSVTFDGANRNLKWAKEPESIGFKYYFPIFLEGLREVREPYKFIAEKGALGMISRGEKEIPKILPDIIFPLKSKDENY